MVQTSMRIAKTEAQEAKEAQFEAQRRQAAAESELEETRARSHTEGKVAAAEVKALKVKDSFESRYTISNLSIWERFDTRTQP